jgi:cytosine/adenosine deaminase-related metal-dependent hydrolase
MLVRARLILPVCGPPVENGAVAISGNRVVSVGRWADVERESHQAVFDLGETILLPGLVNAHCHLDYTDMTGFPPQKQFPDWIKGLVALKAAASYTDYAEAWLHGANMLLRTGTTTVGDIEAVPELLPEVSSSTPLRVYSFLELTGVKSRRKPSEILREASTKIRALSAGTHRAGLSPHALYSTMPPLLRQTARLARRRGWRVAMHVAESREESSMYLHRSGPLFEWLNKQRDMSDCGGVTPVEQVRRCGLLAENFLAIHANCLEAGDIAALAKSGSSVVHCPRSHAYFQHPRFPYKELAAAGVNVCLGTDSLASVLPSRRGKPELNMFAEMRQFAEYYPDVAPEEIVRMATRGGARALGLEEIAGGIFRGSAADLAAIPFTGKTADAWDAVVHHIGDVSACMIEGDWVRGAGKVEGGQSPGSTRN